MKTLLLLLLLVPMMSFGQESSYNITTYAGGKAVNIRKDVKRYISISKRSNYIIVRNTALSDDPKREGYWKEFTIYSTENKNRCANFWTKDKETKKTVFETEPEIKMRRKRKQNQLQENRKKMLDAIGKNAYNGVDLFEGTTPMSAPKSQTSPQGSKPLDGIAPNDPGVDISNFGMASNLWKKLAGK